jgi:hypothetical protein
MPDELPHSTPGDPSATAPSDAPSVATPGAPAEFSADDARFHRVQQELGAESDRGAALLSGAYVDSWLEKAVKSRLSDRQLRKDGTLFHRLFEGANPPLQSFSAKIDLAFALKLIGPHSYDDLGIIRYVRNRFAHVVDFDSPWQGLRFTDQSIEARCNNLWFPKNYIHMMQPHLAQWMREIHHLDTPRGQYIYTVFTISHLIDITVQQTDHITKCLEDMTREGKVPFVLAGSLV